MSRGPSTRPRRSRRRTSTFAVLGLALFGLVVAACAPPPPLGTVTPQVAAAPEWPLIGDPSVLWSGDHYYVFSSNSNSNRLPIHVVDSLSQTYSIPAWDGIVQEGMPQKPAWVADNVLWAPTVAQIGSTYVLFFAANRVNPPDPANSQCIGHATASSPAGPYVAEPTPFNCGLAGTGGALDPALFHAPNGIWYLYAAFGNTESPINVIVLDGSGNANAQRVRICPRLAVPDPRQEVRLGGELH